jgi:hypothetical protein
LCGAGEREPLNHLLLIPAKAGIQVLVLDAHDEKLDSGLGRNEEPGKCWIYLRRRYGDGPLGTTFVFGS